MVEAYSIGVTVPQNSPIPFNNVSIEKGCTVRLVSPTTLQFNQKGIYYVSFNTSAEPTAAGVMSVELSKNSVLQPQAQSSTTGAVDELDVMSFSTYVQVTENNTCCCTSSPTLVQIINTGVEATHTCNICVSKIC